MKKQGKPHHHNNVLGMLYMSFHVIALAALYAMMKRVTTELDSNLVVFLYKFSILLFIIPWCFASGFKGMKTTRIGLHLSRGFLSLLGSLSMFYAIKHIGLSDIAAVQYLEHVIMLIIGVVLFKEKATIVKFFVIALSFLGALIVVRPDLFEPNKMLHGDPISFNHYYIFVFLALGFWAANNTAIKILGRTEKTKVQLFYTTLFSCILGIPFAFMKWQTFGHLGPIALSYPYGLIEYSVIDIQPHHIEIILVLAVCYLCHAITHFKAFKHADISAIIPLEYTRLIYAGFLGYLFFGEEPSAMKYIGYAMIVMAGLLMLYFEKRKLTNARAAEKKVLKEEFDQ